MESGNRWKPTEKQTNNECTNPIEIRYMYIVYIWRRKTKHCLGLIVTATEIMLLLSLGICLCIGTCAYLWDLTGNKFSLLMLLPLIIFVEMQTAFIASSSGRGVINVWTFYLADKISIHCWILSSRFCCFTSICMLKCNFTRHTKPEKFASIYFW